MIFAAALLFSIGGLCVKLIPWNPLSINSFRSILSAIILLLFAQLTRHRLVFTPGVVVGACAMCGTTICYTAANKLTTAANTILLQFTAPVFVILFMWLFFKEKPKKLDIAACLCVFGGIACFFLDSLGAGNALGNALAVLAGVCYAGVFLLNKLGDPLSSVILGQALAAAAGLPWLIRETRFDGRSLGAAVILGVFQLGLAYVFFTTGIKTAPPLSAALVTGVEPILNPLLVAAVLGERLTGLSLLGGAVVFVSIMAYNVLTAKKEKHIQSPRLAD